MKKITFHEKRRTLYLHQIHVAITTAGFTVHQVFHVLALIRVWGGMESCKIKREIKIPHLKQWGTSHHE